MEDLDGTGVNKAEAPRGKLDAEKSKTVFMNLINVDEKAQVWNQIEFCFSFCNILFLRLLL